MPKTPKTPKTLRPRHELAFLGRPGGTSGTCLLIISPELTWAGTLSHRTDSLDCYRDFRNIVSLQVFEFLTDEYERLDLHMCDTLQIARSQHIIYQ